jgi:hypothetical protein
LLFNTASNQNGSDDCKFCIVILEFYGTMFKLDRIYRTEGFGPLPAFSRCMQRNCLRPGSPLTSLQRAKTAIRCETGVASQKKRQSAARIDKTPPLPVVSSGR